MSQESEISEKKWLWPTTIVVVLIVVIGGLAWWNNNKSQKSANGSEVKVGIVTDLSGGAAYWGESTRVGATLAQKELNADGYNVNLVFEDYQLDAAKALTSTQKLVNVDNVDAVYAEFNPAAISAGSFLKGKDKIYLYDAAVTSPLTGNNNAFKTYLDYQAGCQAVAKKFQDQGITKVGSLKVNLEFGELCQKGIAAVYGADSIVSESYNLGDADFKTQVTKMKSAGVGAIINTGFEGDTLTTFKAMKELKLNVPYGTVDDTITDTVKQTYPDQLKGTWSFGFPSVNLDFSTKLKTAASTKLGTEYGAALAYTHVKQIVKALDSCKKDLACATDKISQSGKDNTIGFNGFVDHVADLDMTVKQY